MADLRILDLAPDNIADYGVCGYKDVKKHRELRRKINWLKGILSKRFEGKSTFFKKRRLSRDA